MLGAMLSRQTLSNWVIVTAAEFQDIYTLMKEQLIKSNYVISDRGKIAYKNNQ